MARLLWVLIMYVYRDVTSGASQCITVTWTVTPDSTACCLGLTSDSAKQEKNGTSILWCWDVWAVAVQFTACACVHHHWLYITGIPLRCAWMYVWAILLIPQHWIISWQFLLHRIFFSTTFSFHHTREKQMCRFMGWSLILFSWFVVWGGWFRHYLTSQPDY